MGDTLAENLRWLQETKQRGQYPEHIPRQEREDFLGQLAQDTELGQWPGDDELVRQIGAAPNRRILRQLGDTRRRQYQQVLRAREAEAAQRAADAAAEPSLFEKATRAVGTVLGPPDTTPPAPIAPAAPPSPPATPSNPMPRAPRPVARGSASATPEGVSARPTPRRLPVPAARPGDAASPPASLPTPRPAGPSPPSEGAPPGTMPTSSPRRVGDELYRTTVEPWAEFGKSLVFRGPVALYDWLDRQARLFSKVSGLSYGGAFKQLADLGRAGAAGEPADPTFTTKVLSDVGKFITSDFVKMLLATRALGPVAGLAGLAALEEGERAGATVPSTALEALKGALVGKVFSAAGQLGLSLPSRAGVGATLFPSVAAAGGERRPEALATQAAEGALFMAPGPVAGRSWREILRPAPTAAARPPTAFERLGLDPATATMADATRAFRTQAQAAKEATVRATTDTERLNATRDFERLRRAYKEVQGLLRTQGQQPLRAAPTPGPSEPPGPPGAPVAALPSAPATRGTPGPLTPEGPATPGQPPAPASPRLQFNRVQRGLGGLPSFELWTLRSPYPGLHEGSTYARETLEQAGVRVPPAGAPATSAQPEGPPGTAPVPRPAGPLTPEALPTRKPGAPPATPTAEPAPVAPAVPPDLYGGKATQPRRALSPEHNAEVLARALKGKADLEMAGQERGGKVFREQRGQGGTPEVIGWPSPTAQWFKEATTGPGKLSRQRVARAVQKILDDEGRDTGKDVQRVKELLLTDPEFMRSPFAPRTDEEWSALIQMALAPTAPRSSTPEQAELPVSPQPIGARPLIGREATPEEAPLFSRQAQTAEPEQTRLAEPSPPYGEDRGAPRYEVQPVPPEGVFGERYAVVDRLSGRPQGRVLSTSRERAEELADHLNAGGVLHEPTEPYAPMFYSRAARVLEQKMPTRASRAHVEAILSPANGVKPDELRWTGLDDYLQTKETFTKQEVLAHLRTHQVEIREVMQGEPRFKSYQLPGGTHYRELLLTLPITDRAPFYSPHWPDVPNVLAHVRMNDRTTADGKKVLFLEEIQSDWHQKGRQEGYQPTSEPTGTGKGVPVAPFQKTWHELVLRRMLRYAAEHGYEELAWTTGAQQAERYDLSKQVDRITWHEHDGLYDLSAKRGDQLLPLKEDVPEPHLADYVGKDAAKKILETEQARKEGRTTRTFIEGEDLRVGGSGMKGFYDAILPAYLNQYAKKWGGRVRTLQLGLDEPGVREGIEVARRSGNDVFETRQAPIVHAVPITPAMRRSVLTDSQVLFARQPPYPVRAGDPADADRAQSLRALGDVDRAVSAVRSVRLRAAPPGQTAAAGLRELALAVPRRLARGGWVDLRGAPARTAHDLAAAAEVSRHPGFETFVAYAIKGGRIVAVRKTTSRLAGSTTVFVARKVDAHGRPRGADWPKEIADLQDWLLRTGADAYAFSHNHPSGNSRPSDMDVQLTARLTGSLGRAFAQAGRPVPTFMGHIVRDGGDYHVITEALRISRHPFAGRDFLAERAQPSPFLGRRIAAPADIASVSRDVALPAKYVTILATSGGTVRGIYAAPVTLFTDAASASAVLRGLSRQVGAQQFFSYYAGGETARAQAVRRTAESLVANGTLTDHLGDSTSTSLATEGRQAGRGMLFGRMALSQRGARAGEEPARAGLRGTPEGRVQSADPEVEARIQAASRGIPPRTLHDRLREYLAHLWQASTREFEFLPDTAQFADVRTALLLLQKSKSLAQHRVVEELDRMLGGLTPAEYDLLRRKVLLEDAQHEAEAGRALGFGLTPALVRADLAEVDRLLGLNPKVAQAWADRQAFMHEVRTTYVEAMKPLYPDVAAKLTNEVYFHHQVLMYALAERERLTKGTGPGIQTPTGRGFLKHREGSALDYNAEFIQPEFEVLAQMLHDAQIAKVLQVANKQNIVTQLREQARQDNETRFKTVLARDPEGSPVAETYGRIRQRIAMHLDRLRKIVGLPEGDDLPLTRVQALARDAEAEGHLAARGVLKWIGQRRQLVKETLGAQYVTWEKLVPETHAIFQPSEGNIFCLRDSIPHQLARQLQEHMLESVEITPAQVRQVLAMGGPREEWVLPVEMVQTLRTFERPVSNVVAEMWRTGQGLWKQGALIGPHRVLRYNLRNLSGDAEAAFVGNPRAFLRAWQATNEIFAYLVRKARPTPTLRRWLDRGGMATTLQMQEMGDLQELEVFQRLVEQGRRRGVLGLPARAFTRYWRTARLATDFREAILRYANFLEYRDQIQRTGHPANYGASIQETVDALPDAEDQAFKLSNELIGAYDRVSVTGQQMRRYWWPFWSWKEVNFSRYKQLLKNAFQADDWGTVGRAGATRAAFLGTKFLFRATALWAMLQVWNHLLFPDEERELNDWTKNRVHIVFGRDAAGKILYLDGVGALGDLLAWVGLDAFPAYVHDLMHDRRTPQELFGSMAHSFVNVIANGITPAVKTPFEVWAGRTTYPDVFNPRPIRDTAGYVVRTLTPFGPEYEALRGKPGSNLVSPENLLGTVVQRQDPGWAAYSNWQEIEDRWKARLGKPTYAAFQRSPAGEALAQWAYAVRLGDDAAAKKYRQEYVKQGGDLRKMRASLRNLAPLFGLTKNERGYVLGHLDREDVETLRRAETFYRDEMLRVLPPAERLSLIGSLLHHGGFSNTVLPRKTMPPTLPAEPVPLTPETVGAEAP